MVFRNILRRIIISIPLLLGISLISFFIISLAPGDYLSTLSMNPQISQETIERMRIKFALDKPVITQFFYWLWRILHLDLGESFFYRMPVADLIFSRATNTLILAVCSIFFAWILGIPIGIFSAMKKDTFIDRLIQTISLFIMSVPTFFLAFLGLLFAAKTGFLPAGGTISSLYSTLSPVERLSDRFSHLIIPVIVLGSPTMAMLIRLMRNYFLDALSSEYIIAAKARGLKKRSVFFKHALRNSINPFITIFGYEIGSILSGAALTEAILNLQGLGTLLLKAVLSQDIYLIMGGILVGSVLLIFGNLIADILLTISDPRVKVEVS